MRMDTEDSPSNLSRHSAETKIDRGPAANSDRDTTLASAGPLPVRRPEPNLPTTIGHYRITRLLGEGGMAAVYEAEQEQPRRLVALKVIKAALASPDLLARFERESQALARLHHPGIAQIYEAGSAETPVGLQPFFAMELIHGKPLVQYADEHKLAVRQRLELMIQVCDAGHHAHQRGIIHRDLKPGNILVDESGQPKILDFGLARATDSDTQATRQTDVGQLLGTLAYMSPEQVLADPLALDIRTDIYALGVILYELLAGKMPYTLSRQLHEAVRTIQETDPAPLSSISKVYRGDVETIVTKALEKDKTRRYGSAAGLAGDIRRYLNDEPITAKPVSTAYQLKKFARRHRRLVASVAAVFVVLVAGVVASTREAVQARRAEAKARQESAIAQAVNDFLQNDLLGQASAYNQSKPDPNLTVRTVLDRAAQHVQGKFAKQPEVEAAIRDTIGRTYERLGLHKEAEEQLEPGLEASRRALGADSFQTLQIANDLVWLQQEDGKYAQAETLGKETLEADRRVLGPEHPETLSCMTHLAVVYEYEGKYAQAEALESQALEVLRRVLGPEDKRTLTTMNNLGIVYYYEGKYAQAEALDTQVLEIHRRVLGPEHLNTVASMSNLAIVYESEGKHAQAEGLHSQTLEIHRRVLGPEHPDTLGSMTNLAIVYESEGKYAQAEALYRQVLEVQRRALGPEHLDRLRSMSNLANVYLDEGKYVQAEGLFNQTLETRRRALGPEHPDTLASEADLVLAYVSEDKFGQSEPLAREALATQKKVQPDDWQRFRAESLLGESFSGQQKYADAEPLLLEGYQGMVARKDRIAVPNHYHLDLAHKWLVHLYQAWGKPDKAAEWSTK